MTHVKWNRVRFCFKVWRLQCLKGDSGRVISSSGSHATFAKTHKRYHLGCIWHLAVSSSFHWQPRSRAQRGQFCSLSAQVRQSQQATQRAKCRQHGCRVGVSVWCLCFQGALQAEDLATEGKAMPCYAASGEELVCLLTWYILSWEDRIPTRQFLMSHDLSDRHATPPKMSGSFQSTSALLPVQEPSMGALKAKRETSNSGDSFYKDVQIIAQLKKSYSN